MKKLIASATHEDDIKKLITKYWYANTPIRLVEIVHLDILEIVHLDILEIVPLEFQVYQGEQRMEGFTVKLKKGRYRFEGTI